MSKVVRTVGAGDLIDALDLDLRRESTADQVTLLLREAILTGRLTPGTPLREQQLSTRFSVSRNTIRDSLRTLVHEGLVRHHMHRGAEVLRLGEADVRELYATRLILEPLAAERLASDVDGRRIQMQPMVEAIARMEQAVVERDAIAAAAADGAFHAAIVDLLGSTRISTMFRQVQRELVLVMLLRDIGADDHARLLEEHADLCAIASAGDRVTLASRLHEHLSAASDELTLLSVVHARP